MNIKINNICPCNRGNTFFILFVLLVVTGVSGCKKFLDEKSTISQVIPQTLADLQSLLDNTYRMNEVSSAGMAEILGDNYFISDATFNAFSSTAAGRSAFTDPYIWSTTTAPLLDIYWDSPYTQPIYSANIVLEQIPLMNQSSKDSIQVKSLRGSALFYRAFSFFSLAQVYCRPYAQEYLASPGIILRQTSDAGIIDLQRATVGETYDKIISDLEEATSLLPTTTAYPTRPSQAASYALLARVYLSMRDYEQAAQYANMALQQNSSLMDYNNLPNGSFGLPAPPQFNTEVIFDHGSPTNAPIIIGIGQIDTMLYQSYNANDLRKTVFFYPLDVNNYGWIGGYMGGFNTVLVFDGLATDELYLTRAECSARNGNKDSAMADLNRLLVNRWRNAVPYTEVTAIDAADALAKVLVERRKELVYRGLRWMDIRRLNLEGANITLKRVVNGTEYTLPPNDVRTVMLIPENEISRSGIEQNPR